MRPLSQGKKQVKFLLVTIDCFTKWVEAEALATVIEAMVRSFVWKILCAGSGSHRRSSQIMVVSSIVKDSNHFAYALASRTNINPRGILKPTDRLKQQIVHC